MCGPASRLSVTIDTYPGQQWRGDGRRASARRAGSEFSLLPAQNSSGNWVKVVQRIPLRVAVEPGPTLRRCAPA